MGEHTPTPWKVITEDISLIESVTLAADGCSYIVAHCLDGATSQVNEDTREANAAFIVKAVNSHDALVKALENAKAALETCSDLFSDIRGDWTDPRNECEEGQDVIHTARTEIVAALATADLAPSNSAAELSPPGGD
jgi:citrate lyase beta subunit